MNHPEGTTATEQTKEDVAIAWAYRAPEAIDAPPAWQPGTLDHWEEAIDAAIARMLDEGWAA